MQPNPLESENFKIADVACGTSGFLTVAAEWGRELHKSTKLTKSQKEYISKNAYQGQELVVRPYRLGLMNMFLHGIEANLTLGDSIYTDEVNKDSIDCLLTNPPFGTRGSIGVPKQRAFPVETSNIQINFIQHVYEVLKPTGRAAIVLPDSALTDAKAKEVWQILIGKGICNIHTILKLPRGTFTPYAAGVRACVLFFQKGEKTESLWMYDARSNVQGITKKSRPLNYQQHFSDFVKCYGNDCNGRSDRSEEDRFRQFSLEKIIENNFDLDFKWLEDDLSDEGDLDKPMYYIDEIRGNLNDIFESLKSVESFLQ